MFYAKYQNEIGDLIKGALKAKDRAALNVYKGLKDAVQKTEKENLAPLTEEAFDAVVKGEVKAYRDTLDAAIKGNRTETIAEVNNALEALSIFMPKQAMPDEIEAYAREIITANGYVGANMGQIMTDMKAKFDGLADMKLVAAIVRTVLGK